MVKDLVNCGIIPNKTIYLDKPDISKKYYSHWIRGYFDGDGSVSKCKDRNIRGNFLSSSRDVIKFIVDKNVNSADMDLLVTKLASYKPSDIRIDYDANYNKVQFAEDNEFDLSGVDMSEAITEFINMLDIDNKSEVAKYTTELYNRSVDRPK